MVARFDSVLFDLDGTLTDPRVAITSSMAHALAEVGVTSPPIEELVWCIGPPLRQNLGKLLGPDRAHLIEPAAQAYLRRYAIEGVRETTEYPGIDAMLHRIRSSGARVFLATTKFVDHAEVVLKAFSLRQYFERRVRRAARWFAGRQTRAAQARHRNDRHRSARSVMIGDREHDVLGAKDQRHLRIGVTYGFGTREELVNAGADAICDSPEEILALLL